MATRRGERDRARTVWRRRIGAHRDECACAVARKSDRARTISLMKLDVLVFAAGQCVEVCDRGLTGVGAEDPGRTPVGRDTQTAWRSTEIDRSGVLPVT